MARSASFNQHLTSNIQHPPFNIQHPFSEKTNGKIHRSRMAAVPARRDETVSERRALLFREMRHRKAQLCSRTARQNQEDEKDRGIRAAASRKAESPPHLRCSGNPVPQQL